MDERRNRPSASAIELYFNCPGAWLLSQKVPEAERITNPYMEHGTMLHQADEEGSVEGLELSDQDFLVQARKLEEQAYNEWVARHDVTDPEIIREHRWWLIDSDGHDLCSAKLDLVALSHARSAALVLDLKSGRKPVAPPVRNWQLRTGVVILAHHYAITSATVGIVAPYQKTQPLAFYDTPAIFASVDRLTVLLKEIENPEAPRTAGYWCDKCPARHICPEALAQTNKVVALDGLKWKALTSQKKLELFQLCSVALPIIDAIRENIKAELKADPTSIPGLRLTKTTHPRSINDAIGAYLILQKEFPDVPLEAINAAFNSAVKVKVGALETLHRDIRSSTKAEAEAWLNGAAGGLIQRKARDGHVELEP